MNSSGPIGKGLYTGGIFPMQAPEAGSHVAMRQATNEPSISRSAYVRVTNIQCVFKPDLKAA